jgi:hypothetical protein
MGYWESPKPLQTDFKGIVRFGTLIRGWPVMRNKFRTSRAEKKQQEMKKHEQAQHENTDNNN